MTVYFIEMEGKGWIKIGYTAAAAERRMAQLQTGQPEKLRLLGTIPGDMEAERGLHREFHDHRINGEWFMPAGELIVTIRHLIENQQPWFVGRSAYRRYLAMQKAWESAFSIPVGMDRNSFIAVGLLHPSTLVEIPAVRERLNAAVTMRKAKGRFPKWGVDLPKRMQLLNELKAHLYWEDEALRWEASQKKHGLTL